MPFAKPRPKALHLLSSAAAAGAWSATESRSGGLAALRSSRAGDSLAGNDQFTFLQVAFHNFRGNAVSEPNLDPARLWFAVLAHPPD